MKEGYITYFNVRACYRAHTTLRQLFYKKIRFYLTSSIREQNDFITPVFYIRLTAHISARNVTIYTAADIILITPSSCVTYFQR